MLENLAREAPQNHIDDLIRHRLREMFKPTRKAAYHEVLPLPQLENLAERVRKGRVLAIVSPDANIPPEAVRQFFEGLSQKNNLCVLTGDKTAMGNVEDAARHVYASQKADTRITEGHAQRADLESTQAAHEQYFNATVQGLFDKVLFPVQLRGRDPQLMHKPLDMTRDATKEFNGEHQIEKTLTSNPIKLFGDVDAEFDAIRDKAEDLLWPENQNETRWADAVDRYAEQAAMPWMPSKGLDELKTIACNRGVWEDLGSGYITKKPEKKRTTAQIVVEEGPDDDGRVRLRVNPLNAGPTPQIHYTEDGSVSGSSPQLVENTLLTTALRVAFLVIDPSGKYETGEPKEWVNRLILRNELLDGGGKRVVKLFVAPRGEIRYTLDGSEPREGTPYESPVTIDDGEVLVGAFASADGLEAKETFRFPAKGTSGIQIDDTLPARLVLRRAGYKLDSRAATFDGLKLAADKAVCFEQVTLTVGQGSQVATIIFSEVQVDASFLKQLLENVLQRFTLDTPVTMTFLKAHFGSGHDLKDFCEKVGIVFAQGNVEQ